jgi:LPPG:FO 2-phospho-L-lactate transferase
VITALAGGVGAARFLAGLVQVIDPSDITVIVNTGDDVELHGLWISPDLDTVTYTLAGVINPETGWGLAGETWQAMDALARFDPDAVWFRLGDRDLGTHLYRTHRLDEGAPLSQVAGEIAAALGIRPRMLPMSDERVQTIVTIRGRDGLTEVGFQDYFVARRHDVPVASLRFAGVAAARPAPGVLESIAEAARVIICPSNPLVSIAPIRAVPGVEPALAARRDENVAISPIVAGAAIKGPADRLLTELGHEPSVVGVARLYAPIAGTLVVDTADADLADRVEAEGMACVVTPTMMHGPPEAAALARRVLA